jgi:hypothetical protein
MMRGDKGGEGIRDFSLFFIPWNYTLFVIYPVIIISYMDKVKDIYHVQMQRNTIICVKYTMRLLLDDKFNSHQSNYSCEQLIELGCPLIIMLIWKHNLDGQMFELYKKYEDNGSNSSRNYAA